MRILRGSITSVPGFLACGVRAGIKKTADPDLALIVCGVEATAAACMTQNRFKAAPLLVTREHLEAGRARAIIVNSGNANACTGRRGYLDALQMTRWLAQALEIPGRSVYVASTGVIGAPLPMRAIERAIPKAVGMLSPDGGHQAARAIMTTDTRPKESAVRSRLGRFEITLGGIAKGAGMIHPRMATLLAFIGTDVRISPAALRGALQSAVAQSFNRISVDGDTSTNDLVLCLANGLAGNPAIHKGSRLLKTFTALLTELCQELAAKIIRDGEGATKFVTVQVRGARRSSEAEHVAEAVSRSLLVKTALFGEDPNWGRIMAAIGASGIPVRAGKISILLGGVPIVRAGLGLGGAAEARARQRLRRREILVQINLGMGRAQGVYHTTDLSDGYVRINAAYRT